MRRWRAVLVIGLVLGLAGCQSKAPAPSAGGAAPPPVKAAARDGNRPKLLVLVVVDQLRTDYLWRMHDLMVDNGFRYLMDRGANYPSARYRHFPTYTGPGHACLSTGAYPSQHGIVSNSWWDRTRGCGQPDDKLGDVYCVDDPSVKITGQPSADGNKPMGPRNLLATTIGDELKLATGGQSKVISVAVKDRAAVLMAGHLADAAIWYDSGNGTWISSTAYGPSLPTWVEAVNKQQIPAKHRGEKWQPTITAEQARDRGGFQVLPEQRYGLEPADKFADAINAKVADSGDGYFKIFTETPAAVEFTLTTALEAVKAEKLGARGRTDLLMVSLSSNDYVGHRYGPNSWEVLDYTLRTDRALASFFANLGQLVPGGLSACTVALTADHGVAGAPEQLAAMGLPARAISGGDIVTAAQNAVSARFARDGLVKVYREPYLYLDRGAISAAGLDRQAVQDVAAQGIMTLAGVSTAWSVDRIWHGGVPDTEVTQRLARAIHPAVGGDVIVVLDPGSMVGDKSATTHGQPYVYDSTVPVMMAGRGVQPGIDYASVCPFDISATFAALANILPPSCCEGQVLPCTIRGR